jgi:hypothetical protein
MNTMQIELDDDLPTAHSMLSSISNLMKDFDMLFVQLVDTPRPTLAAEVSKARQVLSELLTAITPAAAPADAPTEEPMATTTPSTPVVPAPSAGVYPIFAGMSFFKDEAMNGDANDIFQWILGADPMNCDLATFLRGLMFARVVRNGKAAALVQDEIVELVQRRAFPQHAGMNKKQVKDAIKAASEPLKANEKFGVKEVKDLTKSYPTLYYYDAAQFELINESRTPSNILQGDDLEDIFNNLSRASTATPVEPQKKTLEDRVAAANARLGL